jgi:hypothetical protein
MMFRATLRRCGFGLMFLGLIGVVSTHLDADGSSDAAKTAPAEGVSNAAAHRMREGSKLAAQLGVFEEERGRFAFHPEGSTDSLLVLENLALQRISRDLELGPRKWSVSGTVTEYMGLNYLLVERAVMKQRIASDAVKPRS